jgi:predicted metal-dependent peptidase
MILLFFSPGTKRKIGTKHESKNSKLYEQSMTKKKTNILQNRSRNNLPKGCRAKIKVILSCPREFLLLLTSHALSLKHRP